MVGLSSKSMRVMISPQTLKMRRRFAKPKQPLKKSEKKRRVTAVTLRKNLNLPMIFSFFVKTTVYFYFEKFSVLLVGLPEHPTMKLLYLVMFFEEENNLRSSERSELERKSIF